MSTRMQRAIAEAVLEELELMATECACKPRDGSCARCLEIEVALGALRAALGKNQAEA